MLKPSPSYSSTSTSTAAKASNFQLSNEETTPQSFWLNTFLRKAASGFLSGAFSTEKEFKGSLVKDLAVAMEAFSVDKFRTDYYFLLIWLSYIKLQL